MRWFGPLKSPQPLCEHQKHVPLGIGCKLSVTEPDSQPFIVSRSVTDRQSITDRQLFSQSKTATDSQSQTAGQWQTGRQSVSHRQSVKDRQSATDRQSVTDRQPVSHIQPYKDRYTAQEAEIKFRQKRSVKTRTGQPINNPSPWHPSSGTSNYNILLSVVKYLLRDSIMNILVLLSLWCWFTEWETIWSPWLVTRETLIELC